MKRLAALVESGDLSPIDAELGGLLTRRAAATLGTVDEARLIGLAGAMLSAERGRGHSCLDLAALVDGATGYGEVVGVELPDLAGWRTMLARSGLCGDGSAASPLVLDGGRLYLYRYYVAECRLAGAMRARLVDGARDVAPDPATVALFRRLFPARTDEPTDLQALAAAAALRGGLTVITGGPGTGKTTTVAKVLALLLNREPDLRVAIAAPTGKAAARLAESIRAGVTSLGLDPALSARIPTAGRTLHRLLGYRPWNDEFAHGPTSPLADDVVVVDEASMVDVLMMDALFAALRPSTRVILLGDQDQLASVDTGFVLGDVCRAADGCGDRHGKELAAWHERLSGQRIQASASSVGLRDAVIRLTRSYRFDSRPGIATLAEAIRAGDESAMLAVLADTSLVDVCLHEPKGSIATLLVPIESSIDRYLAAATPDEALASFGAFRVLCVVREGRTGVGGLNERIEGWLRTRGVQTRARWYHGKPVLVTANDPSTGLYNGDVGVTLIDHGHARIWFHDGDGRPRAIPPARLPAHETAWAMTVHKAQGSEFEHVVLVLPDEDVAVLTRELLYTAVTRASRRVDIFGTVDVAKRAMNRTTRRMSGLADRLRA